MPDSQFWCEEPQMTSLGGVRTAVPPHGSGLKALGWTVQPAGSEAQDHMCWLIIIIIIIWENINYSKDQKILVKLQIGSISRRNRTKCHIRSCSL